MDFRPTRRTTVNTQPDGVILRISAKACTGQLPARPYIRSSPWRSLTRAGLDHGPSAHHPGTRSTSGGTRPEASSTTRSTREPSSRPTAPSPAGSEPRLSRQVWGATAAPMRAAAATMADQSPPTPPSRPPHAHDATCWSHRVTSPSRSNCSRSSRSCAKSTAAPSSGKSVRPLATRTLRRSSSGEPRSTGSGSGQCAPCASSPGA